MWGFFGMFIELAGWFLGFPISFSFCLLVPLLDLILVPNYHNSSNIHLSLSSLLSPVCSSPSNPKTLTHLSLSLLDLSCSPLCCYQAPCWALHHHLARAENRATKPRRSQLFEIARIASVRARSVAAPGDSAPAPDIAARPRQESGLPCSPSLALSSLRRSSFVLGIISWALSLESLELFWVELWCIVECLTWFDWVRWIN